MSDALTPPAPKPIPVPVALSLTQIPPPVIPIVPFSGVTAQGLPNSPLAHNIANHLIEYENKKLSITDSATLVVLLTNAIIDLSNKLAKEIVDTVLAQTIVVNAIVLGTSPAGPVTGVATAATPATVTIT